MDAINRIEVGANVIPAATPESDGTFEWDKTTIVLLKWRRRAWEGWGNTYADISTAVLIESMLADVVRGRAAMDVSGGEYGYDLPYFRRMLDAGAVDVLQADATRCAGITGFIRVAALCEATCVPLSAHTAPSLHAHACCAVTPATDVEYFFDHARIEHMLFDGVLTPRNGALCPDRSRPDLGLALKRTEAARYAV